MGLKIRCIELEQPGFRKAILIGVKSGAARTEFAQMLIISELTAHA
jgi:hypothetical protein